MICDVVEGERWGAVCVKTGRCGNGASGEIRWWVIDLRTMLECMGWWAAATHRHSRVEVPMAGHRLDVEQCGVRIRNL